MASYLNWTTHEMVLAYKDRERRVYRTEYYCDRLSIRAPAAVAGNRPPVRLRERVCRRNERRRYGVEAGDGIALWSAYHSTTPFYTL